MGLKGSAWPKPFANLPKWAESPVPMPPLTPRLSTGPEWGLSFTYDGFGNRTDSTVTKGTASLLIDGNTNRISTSGFSYDANGNLTAMPGGGC
jgi:YD repeat-containing protein